MISLRADAAFIRDLPKAESEKPLYCLRIYQYLIRRKNDIAINAIDEPRSLKQ